MITDQSASLAAQARNDRTDRPVFSVYIAEWHTDLLGCKFNPRQDHHEGRFHPDTSCTPTALGVRAQGHTDFVGYKFNLRQELLQAGFPVVVTDRPGSSVAQPRADRSVRLIP